MDEYRYDVAGENGRRVILLLLAVGSFLASLGLMLLHVTHWLMLVVCPTFVFLYVLALSSRGRRNDRVVLAFDEMIVYQGGAERRIPLQDVEYAYHTGALLHIRVRGQDPVKLTHQVERQEELLGKLNASKSAP